MYSTLNSTALGDNLNDPELYLNVDREGDQGTANPAAQCTIDATGGLLGLMDEGEVQYFHFYRDNRVDQLGILARHFNVDQLRVRSAPASTFSEVTGTWQDIMEYTCTIPSTGRNADAQIGIRGELTYETWLREYPEGEARAVRRQTLSLADNDIRGFRLDGRTWAKDYARYGDGQGVRLEFSKGIAAVTAANFTLDFDGG